MSTRRTKPTAVVIGSGILGVCVAEHLCRFFDVTCYGLREVEGEGPPTDSQRNQAWLQSGMLYNLAPDVALQVALDRRYLLNRYRMQPTMGSTGIFSFDASRLDVIRQNRKLAKKLGYDRMFREIIPPRAEQLLGPLYDPAGRPHRVPDSPFDEAGLIDQVRDEASWFGARFVPLDVGVIPVRTDSGRVIVLLPDGTFESPDLVVVCAGYGTPKIAQALELDDVRFSVTRSVLLTVDDRPMPDCDLYADRAKHLSVVQHQGRVVFGDGGRIVLGDDLQRKVTVEEQEALIDLLPKALVDKYELHRPKSEARYFRKWTAGYKTEEVSGSVSYSILPPDRTGSANLILAVPGKATAAAAVAYRVLGVAGDVLDIDTNHPPRGAAGSPSPDDGTYLGTALHFHEEYDDHDDAADEE